MQFNDFLRAFAEVLKSVAWPAVVLALAIYHRQTIGDLLSRLRRGPGGTVFDKPQAQTPGTGGEPEDILLRPVAAVAGADEPAPAPAMPVPGEIPPLLQQVRTATVQVAEQAMLTDPMIQGIQDPAIRERSLVALAATFAVYNVFERADAAIWASQLALLEYLNAAAAPVPAETLKELFYDQAAQNFPSWYASYNFDAYLAFLASYKFIESSNVGVTIDEPGREYLIWRVRQRKFRKVNG